MPHTNVKSRWVDGDLVLYDKDGNIIATWDGTNRKLTFPASSTLDLSSATVSLPSTTLAKGFIPLPLENFREVSSDATINAAGNGGLLASDTTPILQRVNGATDKALRLNWAASNSDEITQSFAYPPDLDDASAVTVHILAAMAGATDTPTVTVGYFEGVGDSDAGGATAAVTGTTVAEYSRTITAANIGAHPKQASIALVVGAHTTDAAYIYAAWVEYTRKTS